jgi:hypothetical protein
MADFNTAQFAASGNAAITEGLSTGSSPSRVAAFFQMEPGGCEPR